MKCNNYYDVTKWETGNPYEDIGEVINSMIADIKSRQTDSDVKEGGKPGAVIYIPPGDYHLHTQVVIDISYLKIMGVSFSLEDGETVDIGGYQITRKGNKIHTDRGRLVDTSWEMQTEFSTPDLKDGFQIDVYVDPNLIEVFVNDGEYIISNCVYNLGTDIHQQGNVKYEMYTLEGTDVSEV